MNNYTPLKGIIAIGVVFLILVGNMLYNGIIKDKRDNIIADYEYVNVKENRLTQSTKVDIDASGNPSDTLTQINDAIQNVFQKAFTFEDGDEYNKHRNDIQLSIVDDAFFKHLMPDAMKGEVNQIDTSRLKNKIINVDMYSYNPNKHEYLITVEYYEYLDATQLNNKQKLKPQHKAYRVNITPEGVITKGKEVKGYYYVQEM